MAVQQNRYPYTRLSSCPPQLRILKLYAAENPSSPIESSLEVVLLDANPQPKYETVSYTWGNNTGDLALIYVDEIEFYVTTNCVAALRAIRLPAHNKELWVDAICINQTDDIEKGHQVGMMAQIYERGWVNFLHLGLEEEKLRLTIPILDKCKSLFEKRQRVRVADIARTTGKDLDDKDWRGIMNIFEARVWQRIWIVQELALSRDVVVMCGSGRYRWGCIDALTEAILSPLYVNRITADSRKGINTMQSATVLKAIKHNRAIGLPGRDDLLSVWADFGYCGCRDPRDKIYALLGIVHPSKRLSIEPNYQITEQALFCDVTWRYIYAHQDLKILLQAQKTDSIKGPSEAISKGLFSKRKGIVSIESQNFKNKEPLPTWVPQFNSDSTCFVPGFLAFRSPDSEGHRTYLSEGAEIPWQKGSNDLLLQCRNLRAIYLLGISYDRISFVLTGTKSLQGDDRLEYFKAAYLQLRKQFPSEYLNGQTFVELFWRTLASNQYRASKDDFITNILRDNSDALANWTQGLHYMLMNGFKKSKLDPTSRSKPTAAQIEASLIQEQVLDMTPGYTIAFTKKGHCALVPETSCTGDLVCGLAGGSSPVILRLREIALGRTVASLVGPTYVYQHKIREEWKRGKLDLTTFVLI